MRLSQLKLGEREMKHERDYSNAKSARGRSGRLNTSAVDLHFEGAKTALRKH